ncbi:MAG: acyl-ACP--UDP-N-acetylglucosamine O-acyltransferase [Myxococcota bacterium]
MNHIHPTAVIDPGVKIADDVRIGPYAVIGEGVELASGVEIGSHAHLEGSTVIGAATRVFPFAVIGAEPQVRDFSGPTTALVIGRNNVIREFAAIHVGTVDGGGCTRIGDDNLIMNNVHIAHDCQIGSHCIIATFTALAGHVVVEDHVVFGAMTGVHQFARIGESAFTGANSMIAKDTPPFSRVAGDRARFMGMNTIGLERREFAAETIETLRHAFHLLFHSKLRLEPALARVEQECAGPEVDRLLSFLRTSERGFIR